ncbi:MAG: patatin-like phospholipase family protein, partial [Flavobacteriaceae bacterium]|nr:patatin-like phospholipase family protein [Flavobacteriaceae bacterium]
FEKEEFEQIKAIGKKVFFTVSNITQQRVEYFGSDNCSHELYCDMAWASANFVPFMSLFEHNGNMYADGGFGTYIPISQAIQQGATDIDVIVLDSENEKVSREIRHNPFSILLSTFQFMGRQISLKDRVIGELMSINRQIDVRLYYTPRKLIENSLIFEPKLMRQWWQEGVEYARIHEPFCHCHMPGS